MMQSKSREEKNQNQQDPPENPTPDQETTRTADPENRANGSADSAHTAEPAQEPAAADTPPAREPASERSMTEKLMYLQAEFENQKKRLIREQENAIRNANERFIRELLTIVGLFDRALASSESIKQTESAEVKNFLVGIEMTHRELIHLLSKFGVELIGEKGEPFNPERHEAISQVEAPPEKANTVVDIMKRGCLLHGRLLQPAKVVVAKGQEE